MSRQIKLTLDRFCEVFLNIFMIFTKINIKLAQTKLSYFLLSYLLFVIFLSLLNTDNVTFLGDTHKIKWNLT